MAIGDKLKLQLFGSIFNQRTVNVLYYNVLADATLSSNELALAVAFRDLVMPEWTAAVSSDWSAVSISVQRFRPLPLLVPIVLTVALPGLRAAGACPPQSAMVIKKESIIARRADRGRVYIAGIAEVDHTAGLLVSPAFAALSDLAAELDNVQIEVLGGGQYQPVIFSKFLNGIPRDAFPGVVNGVARQTVFTQRRRTVGVGV